MARVTREQFEETVGEPVLASADAQSLESRYGRSVRGGGAVTGLALRGLAKRHLRDDAVRLPRFFTFVAGEGAVHVVTYAKQGGGGVARTLVDSILRGQAGIETQSGLFWTKIVVVNRAAGRSYTGFLGRITPARGALLAALG